MSGKEKAGQKSLSKSEYEALSNFRYALRSFLKFSKDTAEYVGLTPRQHQALLAIKGFKGRERITKRRISRKTSHQTSQRSRINQPYGSAKFDRQRAKHRR